MATVIDELRNRGHDVLWVKETMPISRRRCDPRSSAAEQRLVLTHDKTSGELAFRYGFPAACGV